MELDLSKSGHCHLHSRTPEYAAWIGMLQRCGHRGESCKVVGWEYYGGRGIKVCQAWQDSFQAFLYDVGSRPSAHHILGRIDTDRNYEPTNVHWVLRSHHSRRVASKRKGFPYSGGVLSPIELAQLYGLRSATLRKRIALGWPLDQALKRKVRGRKSSGNET